MKKNSKKSGKKADEIQSKVTAEGFLEKLKPLGVEIKEDRVGNIGIKMKGAIITYIQRKKAGFKTQVKKRDSNGHLQWFHSTDVSTEEQVEEMVSLIRKFKKTQDKRILIKLGFLHPDELGK